MAVRRTQRVEGECFLALHRHAVNALDPFADVVLARRCFALPLLVAVEGGEAAMMSPGSAVSQFAKE